MIPFYFAEDECHDNEGVMRKADHPLSKKEACKRPASSNE
jgi:hypothetical protein